MTRGWKSGIDLLSPPVSSLVILCNRKDRGEHCLCSDPLSTPCSWHLSVSKLTRELSLGSCVIQGACRAQRGHGFLWGGCHCSLAELAEIPAQSSMWTAAQAATPCPCWQHYLSPAVPKGFIYTLWGLSSHCSWPQKCLISMTCRVLAVAHVYKFRQFRIHSSLECHLTNVNVFLLW